MANIQKRENADGTISYRVQIRLKGHPTQTATFARITDAKRWVQQTEAAIREGRFFKTAEAKKHTLEELIKKYKDEVLPTKPASIPSQGPQLSWWAKQLGAYALQDITPARIAEAKAILAKTPTRQGKKRSNGSINRYLAALSHAFTMAVKEWGWMDENPLRKVTRTKEPRGRMRFLSDEERHRLLEVCKQSRLEALHPIVVVGIYTGMRRDEIRRMKWSEVDFERTRVVVYKTKNTEPRQVPLPRPALGVLQEWKKARSGDSPLVFPSKKNPKKLLSFRKAWANVVERAGLEDFHFHDLRHTTASYLAMSGASLAEIAEILGHRTLSMVKRYAHLTISHTSTVAERMAAKFSDKPVEAESSSRSHSA